MKWFSLILWLAICFSAAGIGSWFTAGEIAGWYRTLARPSIAPPNWVFGPVWTLLYALMAIAAWQVWLAAPSNSRTWGLSLFLVQLGLNLAWSWVFFHAHQIGFALIEVIFLWAAIGSMGLSLGLRMLGMKEKSQFVAHWASPLLILGLYNKVVKVAGSDRVHAETPAVD